jgi:hypothetical protein
MHGPKHETAAAPVGFNQCAENVATVRVERRGGFVEEPGWARRRKQAPDR